MVALGLVAVVLVVFAAGLAGRATRSRWVVAGPLLVPFGVLLVGSDVLLRRVLPVALPENPNCAEIADLLAVSALTVYPCLLWAAGATGGRLWRARTTNPQTG